jgi:hypothetical protein
LAGVRKRGEAIRGFILNHVAGHPTSITTLAAKNFGVTRQAINHHIRRLVEQDDLTVGGTRSRPIYQLRPLYQQMYEYSLDGTLEEDVIWRTAALQYVADLPANVVGIWEYGFTEMVNNAIDHSKGQTLEIGIYGYKPHVEICVRDNGVGIFKKIKDAMGLEDERHSVLELAKGKFTTDPDSHTGEGIFFSSRMFDEFEILSGDVYYAHDYDGPSEWIAQAKKSSAGTAVWMRLNNNCKRTEVSVFDAYAGPEDYTFTKTVVPVDLARYGDDTLVSRSQAKRMLVRIDRFTKVIFDFKNVDSIGHSFADEIFRVFANRHPEIEISSINANKKVRMMISRAQGAS